MKHISVQAFKEVVEAEKGNFAVDFINVCTLAEYKEKHIDGVRSLPLDEIQNHVDELSAKKTIYVHCRSGVRGRQAVEKLKKLGVRAEVVNVEGGILAWGEAGFATISQANRLPIMRQVFITAGTLVVGGYLLSMVVNPQFIWLSVFVGVGLMFSGITGWCGMSYLLAKMPWNK